MIYDIKNLSPGISFGFGSSQQTVTAGTTVTVWLTTLYNEQAYTFSLTATGSTVNKISNYEYVLTYAAPGSYTISLRVSSTTGKTSLESNILDLIVTANEN